MVTLLTKLKQFNDAQLTLCKNISAALMLGMFVLFFVYVLLHRMEIFQSLTWMEELCRFMMIWIVFLSIPVAMQMGVHVNLEIIYKKFTGRNHFVVKILLKIFILFLLIILLFTSIPILINGISSTIGSLPISQSYAYVAMPIGFILTGSVCLEILLESIHHLHKGEDDHEEHHLELAGE